MHQSKLPAPSCLVFLLALVAPATASELKVTTGAAPGYVVDEVCARCHRDHYEGFQHVGMAQSFKRPENARTVERFGETFYHEDSQRYYEVHKRQGGLDFRRYQRDSKGAVVNEVEIPVDWVLGSGNRTRSYLYQNDHGELFQLPIGWYAEGEHWEMSPGFESREHDGIGRKLTRECMFCHNAYPEWEFDGYADAELFPQQLPEGIGCQRCHGPGAKHVAAATGSANIDAVRDAIVNPGKLTGERRDSVCLQCHLLPAVGMPGPRRFGRGDYSFRPGEPLTDYVVHLDVREHGVPEPERFEINHHGYRLLKSACYQQSEGALTCTSCHDPHVKPEATEFRQQVAGICRDCHAEVVHEDPGRGDACVTCHMPTRRTRDVIHVTMTDHWISRGPFDLEKIVEPVEAETHRYRRIEVLEFGQPPTALDAQAFVALGAMRAGRSVDDAARSLLDVLRRKEYRHYEPYLDYVRAQLQLGRFGAAADGARGLINGDPTLHAAHSLLGIAESAQGRFPTAIEAFTDSLELQADPESCAFVNSGRLRDAEVQLERALTLRPTLAAAHRLQGQIHLLEGDSGRARDALQRALRMDPGDAQVYALLIPLLQKLGDRAEAQRYIELGRRSARRPEMLPER